ncbi:MAG TPA: GNAT family N-acetyltransferase [Allosphingosinicella sp.]
MAGAGIEIAPLAPADRPQWEALARGYKAFYGTETSDEDYRRTWDLLMKDATVHGIAARLDGTMVGFAHYLFHPHSWQGEVCYLQDLFTAEGARGRGVARAMIDRIADTARRRGAARFYWLTKADNAPARTLYERIARHSGFIRYDYPM